MTAEEKRELFVNELENYIQKIEEEILKFEKNPSYQTIERIFNELK